MALIEREYKLHSIIVDKKFLINLFNIINRQYPKNVGMRTEIRIHSEQERSTFGKLSDFIESRILPKNIKKIFIKKIAANKKERNKVIQFFLNVDFENPNNSSYQLMGYDDGKLLSCKKQLDNLFDEYKTWYSFLFILPHIEGLIPALLGISSVLLLWRLLLVLPKGNIYGEWYKFIFIIIGIVVWHTSKRINSFLFPFVDLQIKKTKRSDFWRAVMGIISAGLIINLIWRIIEAVF